MDDDIPWASTPFTVIVVVPGAASAGALDDPQDMSVSDPSDKDTRAISCHMRTFFDLLRPHAISNPTRPAGIGSAGIGPPEGECGGDDLPTTVWPPIVVIVRVP